MAHSLTQGDAIRIETSSRPSAEHEAFGIYRQALGGQWPLSPRRFSETSSTQMLIARRCDQTLGFALLDHGDSNGYIQIVAVRPPYQSQGIGSALLRASEQWLAQRGVTIAHVGRGRRYLWQGAPEGCEGFFRRHGYVEMETSIDMTLDLARYSHPPWVDSGLAPGTQFRHAGRNDAAILPHAFQDDDVADWLSIYIEAIAAGAYQRILLATLDEQIVGFVLVLTKGMTWEACFPGKTGGLGCLGVKQTYRNRGIGRALAALATSQLKHEGMDTSYVAWTWLEDWYGALGYVVWRRFHMMQKPLQ
jgi:beta-N-acetylhexosaminidase